MLNDCQFQLGEAEDTLDRMAPVARDLDTLAAQTDEIEVSFFLPFLKNLNNFPASFLW